MQSLFGNSQCWELLTGGPLFEIQSIAKIGVKSLRLVLPAIIPSWNFFDTVAPSPRVEYRTFSQEGVEDIEWVEFWPKPDHVSLLRMGRRIFWNPCWNEGLYVTACAERLIKLSGPEDQRHSAEQIARRISSHLMKEGEPEDFQFRLVFLHRRETTERKTTGEREKVEGGIARHVLYVSERFSGADA